MMQELKRQCPLCCRDCRTEKKIELAAGNPEERENRHAAETEEQRSEGGGSGTVSGVITDRTTSIGDRTR